MPLEKPLSLNFGLEAERQLSTQTTNLEALIKQCDEQTARAEAHKKDLEATRKKLAETEARLKEQQAENKRLQAENQETQRRQELLVAELEKAEAQAELIKEMLLDEEQQQRLKNTKKDA